MLSEKKKFGHPRSDAKMSLPGYKAILDDIAMPSRLSGLHTDAPAETFSEKHVAGLTKTATRGCNGGSGQLPIEGSAN